MKRFSFTKLGRTLLMLTAVIAVGLAGCGGDDNPSNNNNDNGGNNNNSGGGGLVLGTDEAWVKCYDDGGAERCEGWVFKKDGKVYQGRKEGGSWGFSDDYATYSTSGDKLTIVHGEYTQTTTYSISGNKLTMGSSTYTKTSGVKSGIGGSNNGNNNTGNDTTHTHDWGAWEVTTPATCDAAGVETRICKTDASHKETRAIPKLTGAACDFVEIGGLKWMKKNLNVETVASWASWCYDNSPDSCAKYGRLYIWSAAIEACPIGWRLPDTSDWNKLVAAAGGESVGGKALKSSTGWYNNGNGTDKYGFSALPGGSRYSTGTFNGAGNYGFWWTATVESRSNHAYFWQMDYVTDKVYVRSEDSRQTYGYSVRCVKDE